MNKDEEYDDTSNPVMRGPPGEPGNDGRDGKDGLAGVKGENGDVGAPGKRILIFFFETIVGST